MLCLSSANGALFYNPNGAAAGFATTSAAGDQFVQLLGPSTSSAFAALSSTALAMG